MSDGPAARPALDGRDQLGEGPHWDVATGELLHVDIRAGRVHRWRPGSGTRRSIEVGRPVSVAIPGRAGRLILACEDELLLTDESGGGSRVLARIEAGAPGTKLNDGKCDPRGRLWIGTYSGSGEPGAALYRVTSDGRVRQVRTGIGASNGLAWNGAADRFYHTDTAAGRIDVLEFNLDRGELGERVDQITFAPADGVPDGIAADAEGGVWVAMFGGGSVRRYGPSGVLDAVVRLPVPHPTSLAFGGAELDVLYVTSSFHRLTAQQRARYPLAGAVFEVDPGVRGVPVARFGPATP